MCIVPDGEDLKRKPDIRGGQQVKFASVGCNPKLVSLFLTSNYFSIVLIMFLNKKYLLLHQNEIQGINLCLLLQFASILALLSSRDRRLVPRRVFIYKQKG